jgi:Acetyltransferase (GNAT) domain
VGPDRTLTVPPTPTAPAPALLLRPWADEDIPAMVEAHRDPAMRGWLRHPITTADDASAMISARHADAAAGTGFAILPPLPRLPRRRPPARPPDRPSAAAAPRGTA